MGPDRSALAQSIIPNLVAEMEDIDFRKPNLMVFGLLESRSPLAADRVFYDKQEFAKIVGAVHADADIDFEVKVAIRIGRKAADTENQKRPLKIVLASEKQKFLILKNASRLYRSAQYKHISLRPDLTKNQLINDKVLRDQVKSLRLAGKKARIVRGVVVVENMENARAPGAPFSTSAAAATAQNEPVAAGPLGQ